VAGAVAGCVAPLSALDPAGPVASSIARLWWVMLAGATAIFSLVMGLLASAFRRGDRRRAIDGGRWILWGGIVLPSVTLAILLVYSLALGERVLARAATDAFVVEATAGRYAWSFRYPADAEREPSTVLRIPVGRPVELRVTSTDVVHSFWAPALAGKIDAIPGRVTTIRLRADRPGRYHGQCAEFCGAGHSVMAFVVEATEEPARPRTGP
jgi:cytochrome c oxidase subunit 2